MTASSWKTQQPHETRPTVKKCAFVPKVDIETYDNLHNVSVLSSGIKS